MRLFFFFNYSPQRAKDSVGQMVNLHEQSTRTPLCHGSLGLKDSARILQLTRAPREVKFSPKDS